MTPDPLTELENQLRAAVIAGRYQDVCRIAPEFCAAAQSNIAELCPGDPLRRETILYVDRTLDWARTMMILARATLASELRRYTFLHKYVSINLPAAATFARLEA